ncbi:hypothetical protein RhiirB3_439726 [Rhizophagus irregularis]|nr:hypothetical protein RhiirB3_439726 [Rhizophagus irregularis]
MPEFIISPNDYEFKEQVEELSQLIKKITKAYGIVRSSKEYGVAGSSKEYGVARSSKSAPPPSSSSSSSLSSSSSPSPSPFPSPSSSFSSSNSSFLYYEEMDRDLRTALRNEIAGIMDRLLEDKALNTRKTFDSQRKLVQNNIILVVQKMINKNIFSVSDGVIKYIVHERHHHQRELLLNSEKDANWKDIEKRRKHANSRRSDVNIKSLFLYYLIL